MDTGQVRLATLTVIVGANSAGKSSLGHLLLALKQTALSSDRSRALHLGDENSLIDLGTFDDCLHGHDLTKTLGFCFEWTLSDKLRVQDPVNPASKFSGNRMHLDVKINADSRTHQPRVSSVRYELSGDGQVTLDVSLDKTADDQFELRSERYDFKRSVGRRSGQEGPEKFYRLSDVTMARYRNAGFMSDFSLATEEMLDSIYYLGPLRKHPSRIYQWSGDTPRSVGQSGESVVSAILAAQSAGRRILSGSAKRAKPFDELVALWLKSLGVIHDFSVRAVAKGRKEYEVLVRTHPRSPEVKITDVGFGVSQVLPALVQAFYCPPNSTVWMEQPEIHLHPQVQAELADVFIAAIKARENGEPRNTQLIIESHSEHFLNRLLRRVAEEMITPDDIAVYFCRPTGNATELEPLQLDEYGEIENWPDNFFGDEMADIAARSRAALVRKKRAKQSSSGIGAL